MKSVDIISLSEKGPVRHTNQDRVAVLEKKYGSRSFFLVMLCDGIGGLAHGERAAEDIILAMTLWFESVFPTFLPQLSLDELKEALVSKVRDLNDCLLKKTTRNDEKSGTTLVLSLFSPGSFLLNLSIGDSRIYLISNDDFKNIFSLAPSIPELVASSDSYLKSEGDVSKTAFCDFLKNKDIYKKVHLLTEDQNVMAFRFASNKDRLGDLLSHPMKDSLVECIGVQEPIYPIVSVLDLSEIQEMTLILCSDGFYSKSSREKLYAAFSPEALSDQKLSVDSLKEYILSLIEEGERDNISAVIVRFLPNIDMLE